ncbi:MAG TPA: hypothetical protein DCG19_07215 [Cryomorphaceae bacterium]|nr:hypothetical protein [Owenweeksia sp.]HAD97180.1 hypothetical protein [Cryomorphaceae bacterium]
MKLESLRLIQELSVRDRLHDENQKYRFLNLFEDRDVAIANEFLPSNKLKAPVSLDEYLELFNRYGAKTLALTVDNIRPYYISLGERDSKGQVIFLDAHKTLTVTNAEGIQFKDTLDLRYTIVHDPRNESYTIRSVDYKKEPGKYLVIHLNRKQLMQSENPPQALLINGKKITLQRGGYGVLSGLQRDSILKVTVYSEDYLGRTTFAINPRELTENGTVNYAKPTINIKSKRLFIEPCYGNGTSPMMSFTINTDESGNTITGELSYSGTGLRLGYDLYRFGRFYISPYLALSNRNYTGNYHFDQYKTTLTATDNDGDEYQRKIKVVDFHEAHNFSMSSYGLGLLTNYQASKYLKVGLSIAYQRSSITKSYYEASGIATYAALYGPENFNIEITGTSEAYEQAYDVYNDERVSRNSELSIDGFNSFQAGVSLELRLNKWLFATAAYRYESMKAYSEFSPTALTTTRNDFTDIYSLSTDTRFTLASYALGLKIYVGL